MNLDGRKVLMTRAPMITPAVVYVRVVADNSPLADFIEEDSVYISPLGQSLNGGDCDGDNNAFADAEDSNLAVSTVKDIVENFIARTGSDQLNPGQSYWGDHYNVLSAKDVAKKRKLLNNFSLDTGVSVTSADDRNSLPVMLEGSTQMFEEAVGWAHRVFLTLDLYLNVLWVLLPYLCEDFPTWKPEAFTRNKALVLISAENYEVPLGGLDWGAYDVIFKSLIPVLTGTTPKNIDAQQIETVLKADMRKAGMKADDAHAVLMSFFKVGFCRSLSTYKDKDKEKFFAQHVLKHTDPDGFICLCAEIATLISKAQIDLGNPQHKAMLETFMTWLDEFDPEHELVEKSATLMQIYEYVTVMLPAQLGEVPEIDLDYFC